MNAMAAFFPFTVTLVPSRLVGNAPFTISVEVFHCLESPTGAKLVPNTATQDPAVMGDHALGPAGKLMTGITLALVAASVAALAVLSVA